MNSCPDCASYGKDPNWKGYCSDCVLCEIRMLGLRVEELGEGFEWITAPEAIRKHIDPNINTDDVTAVAAMYIPNCRCVAIKISRWERFKQWLCKLWRTE